jgi:hypothetical protein
LVELKIIPDAFKRTGDDAQAKGNFRPDGRQYRGYYDEETRELIRNWYAPEIALLNYKF